MKNQCIKFQASDLKDNYFLNLLDDDLSIIESLYIKEELWIKHFRHSNLLYIRAIQVITNHTLIGEYYFRFFLRKNFSYLCESYSIETRYHILYNCRRFNKYQNLLRNMISQLVAFLKFNPSTFSFHKGIIQYNYFLCSLYTQLLLFFLFLFFYFSIFLFFFVSSYISSYNVAIIVCYCTLYNKLLI